MMQEYKKQVEALRHCIVGMCHDCSNQEKCRQRIINGEAMLFGMMADAADAIETLQAEVKRLQDKLCDWCSVCPKERRKPEDCEMLSETPVMYGPSDAVNVEAQE